MSYERINIALFCEILHKILLGFNNSEWFPTTYGGKTQNNLTCANFQKSKMLWNLPYQMWFRITFKSLEVKLKKIFLKLQGETPYAPEGAGNMVDECAKLGNKNLVKSQPWMGTFVSKYNSKSE